MKKMVLLALVGIVLFGVSASVSWLLQRDKRVTTATVPPRPSLDDMAWDKASMDQPAAKEKTPAAEDDSVRVAVRPPFNQGAEELVQLANSYHEKLNGLREREAQLSTRQKQMELVYQDIRGERVAIDQLRKQISEELNAARQMQQDAEKSKGEVDEQRQKTAGQVKDLEQRLIKVDGIENNNVQRMAEMLNNMAPENAARILQQMADSGKLDTAVKLLGLMKERQAAKVLAEFSDPAAAAQLLDKLKDLKRSPDENKK